MRELTPHRDMIALIRIQPKVSWRTYMLCIMDVCIYAITAFWWLLTSIIYALLPITSAKPTLYWNQAYLTGWLFFLGIAIFVARIMSKAIKELRGLRALSRTHSSHSPKFSWNQFLSISLPHWLYAEEVLHDPSPTSVLDRVQGSEVTMEELNQIYQDMIEPVQTHSSMSILISLSHNVTISIVGQSGQMESITIQTKSQASMIAFLATRGEGRGAWVLRDEILKNVYGKSGTDQQARFNTDKYRINQKIQEALKEAETTHSVSLVSSNEIIDIFEQGSFDNKPHWRLSPTCEIDECNTLTTLHRRVQAAKEENATALSRDELRPACHQLMETIGQGFLATCQEDDGKSQISREIWPWATETYITHRNQCLDILEYAAQQESATVKSVSSSKEERRDAAHWQAKLFRWKVHVAIGIIPEAIKAEEALCKCLKLYKKLVAPQNAKTIFQQYKERMKELNSTWQPSTQVVNSWSEIVEYEMSKE